jgi:hypothetical protein
MRFLFISATLTGLSASSAFAQELRINAGEEPEQKPWSQPASISYTSNEDAKDSLAIDIAARLDFQPASTSTGTIFVRGVTQLNTQQKKEVQNFEGQVGYAFDFDTADHGPGTDHIDIDAWYFFGDAKLGIQDKTIFADPKANCTIVPLPAECGKQHETSLRGTVQLQPFLRWWEQTIYQNPDTGKWNGLSYSFSPVFGLFYDHILSAKVNASGIEPGGSAAGVKVEMNGAVAPRLFDYRLVFRGKVQWTEAFQRDERRREAFGKSSLLYKVSADYELGRRSFDTEGSKWVPAVGFSYTKGDDPLSGKSDQDAFVIGLKLTFKAK